MWNVLSPLTQHFYGAWWLVKSLEKKKMLPSDHVGMLPTVCKHLQMTAEYCVSLRTPVVLMHPVLGGEWVRNLLGQNCIGAGCQVSMPSAVPRKWSVSFCGTDDIFGPSSVGMYSHSFKPHVLLCTVCVAYVPRILHKCVAATCLRLFFLHTAARYAKKKEHKNNPESSRRLAGDTCCNFRSSI